MGVINVTPDSFSDTVHTVSPEEALSQAEKHMAEGADILDIGGCSTRPDGEPADEAEERRRVMPALAAIREHMPKAVLSVDTFRASIAEEGVTRYGVDIINDISGGEWDSDMFRVVAATKATYVLSHMPQPLEKRCTPCQTQDIMSGMLAFFESKLAVLQQFGAGKIWLDPGFGFAKSVEQNYEVLRRLDELGTKGLPILAGLSRKSMIYKPLGISPQQALNGTTALNMTALMKGASVLRVHDVREARQVVSLYLKTFGN